MNTIDKNKVYENFTSIKAKSSSLPEKEHKKSKKGAILGSAIGVAIGFGACVASKKAPCDIFIKHDFKKTAKNLFNHTKLDYEGLKGYFYMLAQISCASLGSFIGSTIEDKKNNEFDEKHQKEKIKHAIFTINNVAFPAALTKIVEFGLEKSASKEKNNILKTIGQNKFLKHAAVFAALIPGLFASTKITNIINNAYDPENKTKKSLKPKDLLVHIDDIIPILISTNASALSKLPLDRALPFIYGFVGSEVGNPHEHNHNHRHE